MATRTFAVVFVLVLCSGIVRGQVTADTPSAAPTAPYIRNIGQFLEQCPDRDPAYAEIKKDFEIRKDGNPTTDPVCTEPISAMPIAQYTDALIVRQGLRVIYYMDRGQSGHLPWTPGTMYDWMKSKIGGININTGLIGGYCCSEINGKRYINIGTSDDPERGGDREWSGIAGNIDFYAHEVRHVDGYGHSSCCGIANGCDDSFDPANLSAYGVQWWLIKLWLDGTINVGFGCLKTSSLNGTAGSFVESMNLQYRGRFCTILPPLVTKPALPGGTCPPTTHRRAARK